MVKVYTLVYNKFPNVGSNVSLEPYLMKCALKPPPWAFLVQRIIKKEYLQNMK